ncbi:helix-turn-helix domain-containing protein [Streptococcus suis]|nr:helix-turn-helix domain-containing protein [Streptococcus suis]
MKEEFAKIIKQQRKLLGMSQKTLADGICTQTIISRIEKAEVVPSVELFFRLVKKLQIPLSIIGNLFDMEYVKTNQFFNNNIKMLLYKQEYELIEHILLTTDQSFFSTEDHHYYTWLNAIVLAYHYNKKIEAIQILIELLEQQTGNSLLTLQIHKTIGNIYSVLEDYPMALKYYEVILPQISDVRDFELTIKFFYGIARCYYLSDQLDKALSFINMAIDDVLEKNSLFMLGNLYLLHSYVLGEIGLFPEALTSIDRAIWIYDIEKNERLKLQALAYKIKLEKSF